MSRFAGLRMTMMAALVALIPASAALAQAADASASATAADNGTDPTRLRRSFWTSYEHLDFGNGASRDTLKIMAETPLTPRTALRVSLPFAGLDAPGFDAALKPGDLSLRLKHLASIDRRRGIVLQAELSGDTAAGRGRGAGATVLEGTVIYARFLPGGAILAPALSHAESLHGADVSDTTLDFYYVPKLPDPWYMTVDPAIIHDWTGQTTYGSVAVTAGRAVGHVGKGLAQVYLKPGILIGADRPGDWALEAGFRVIGF